MRDLITSGVKTGVQVAVAAFVSWLVSLGVALPDDAVVALQAGVFAVVTGVVGVLLNWIGQKVPVINKIVSLGLTGETVKY